jgi:hypothetical protein
LTLDDAVAAAERASAELEPEADLDQAPALADGDASGDAPEAAAPQATAAEAADVAATDPAQATETVAEAPAPTRRGKRKSRGRDKTAAAEASTETETAPAAPQAVDGEIDGNGQAAAAAFAEPAVEAAKGLPDALAEEATLAEAGSSSEGTFASAADAAGVADEPLAATADETVPLAAGEDEAAEGGEIANLVGVHESSDDVPAVEPGGNDRDDETDPNGEGFLAAPLTSADGDVDPEGGTHS